MNKKNSIVLTVLILITIFVIGLVVYSIINKKEINDDAIIFRDEYMKLNDKINETVNKPYLNIIISETNTVRYLKVKDAINKLENDNAIIYFGYSTCPTCRAVVPTLTKVAEENNEKIYYVDILDISSSFELDEGAVKKIKEGTEDYYKILKFLDSKLDYLFLTDEAGNRYNTGEKSLIAPTIVAVKDGKITGIHIGSVSSHTNIYEALTSDEESELEKKIIRLFKSKKDNEVCTPKNC